MPRIGLSAVILTALLVAFGRAPRAQIVGAPIASPRVAAAGVVVISPSVVATYQFSAGGATLVRLQSLVLWRGSAGWHARRPADRTPVPPRLPLISGSLWVTRNAVGGIDLSITSDAATSVLLVQGQTVDLQQGNVVLMDFVDQPQGPTIVDTMRIEAQVPDMTGADLLVPVLAGVPALSAFLRCEVPLPASAPKGGANLCSRVSR